MESASAKTPELSVVIPAWNEEGNIARVVTDARKAAEDLGISCEVLVMDGDSVDKTREEAEKAGGRAIIERGGFAESLRRGFRESVAPWILVVDGDGSHPLDRFPDLWAKRHEADIVVGSRLTPGGELTLPGWRNALTRVLNFFFRRIMGACVADSSSGYRLYRAEKVRGLEGIAESFEFQQETLLDVVRNGGTVAEVPIHYRWRESGESKARVLKLGAGYLRTVARIWFGGESRWVWRLLGAGFAVRIAAGWFLTKGFSAPPPDLDSYLHLAGTFAEHWSFLDRAGAPTAWREPVYPLLLGTVFKATGVRYGALLTINALLSTGGLWFAHRVGKRLLGGRTALIALAIGVVYPHFVYYAAMPMRESAQLLVAPLAVLALLETLRRGEDAWVAVAAATTALAALTNTTFLPFGLLLVPPLFLYFRPKRAPRWIAIYWIAFSLFYAPWPIRNYLRFDRFILGSTAGAGSTFHNYLIVPQEVGGTPEETRILMNDPVVQRGRAIPGLAEREAFYWKKGLERVAAAPLAYARLVAWRFFVDIWRVTPRDRSHGRSMRLIRWASLLSDGWILPLGVIGLLLVRLSPPEMLFPYLLLLSVNGVYALVLTSVRYRLSAMPWVILLAAAVLDRAWERLKISTGALP